MEAGFAAASEGELEAIKLIANAGLRAEVYSMARGVKKDIDAVLKTGAQLQVAGVFPDIIQSPSRLLTKSHLFYVSAK